MHACIYIINYDSYYDMHQKKMVCFRLIRCKLLTSPDNYMIIEELRKEKERVRALNENESQLEDRVMN